MMMLRLLLMIYCMPERLRPFYGQGRELALLNLCRRHLAMTKACRRALHFVIAGGICLKMTLFNDIISLYYRALYYMPLKKSDAILIGHDTYMRVAAIFTAITATTPTWRGISHGFPKNAMTATQRRCAAAAYFLALQLASRFHAYRGDDDAAGR